MRNIWLRIGVNILKKLDKIVNKIYEYNLYSIIFKVLGIGFIIIGIITLILPLKYDNRFVSGLTIFFGIMFLGTGEIIHLLQRIVNINDNKKRK